MTVADAKNGADCNKNNPHTARVTTANHKAEYAGFRFVIISTAATTATPANRKVLGVASPAQPIPDFDELRLHSDMAYRRQVGWQQVYSVLDPVPVQNIEIAESELGPTVVVAKSNKNGALAQMQALPTVLQPIVRIRKEELA